MDKENQEIQLKVTEEWENERIDKFLSSNIETLSRNYIQKLLDQGQISVNDRLVSKCSQKLVMDDQIKLYLPPAITPDILPEDITLDILYEDVDVIVINKPKGMVVHPAPGHYQGTLVNALLFHCKDNLSGINGVLRPGIVHRIDRDTTGSVIACKNDLAHAAIAQQLKDHTIVRKYQAIVQGVVKEDEGTIHTLIGRHPKDRKKMTVVTSNGKDAVTHFKVLKRFERHTYVECQLETGRTHQIRVHMAYLGYPLLGDEVYGIKDQKHHLEGQTLHAKILGFVHPTSGEYMETDAPLPEYFQKLLQIL